MSRRSPAPVKSTAIRAAARIMKMTVLNHMGIFMKSSRFIVGVLIAFAKCMG